MDEATPLDYRNQAAVPDHPLYFTRWMLASADVRIRRRCTLDVCYGPGWRERCDVFSPDAPASGRPIFIFVHGGWWYFLDKFDYSYLAPAFIDRGIVFVAISYPLAPRTSMSGIVSSVRSAVRWVREHAVDLGGDPERIHIGGHSAGGHLAAMAALTPWEEHGMPADVLKSCCAISGLYDLLPIWQSPHNERIGLDEAQALANSPARQVRAARTRMLVSVGAAELSGFLWQHHNFLSACRAHGLDAEDATVAAENHFGVVDHLGNADSALFRAVHGAISCPA